MTLSDSSERDSTKLEREINELVNFIRDVDDEGVTAAAFGEIRSYIDQYIKYFGRKYRIAGHDADEIEQECLYALQYKAIKDFDPSRGKFRSFAILCIKRHLYSLIKGNNQQKRKVLNQSLSLDEDRGDEGEKLSLINLITEDGLTDTSLTVVEELERRENHNVKKTKLLAKLSRLEQEVCFYYLKQYRYEEIVVKLQEVFPDREITKKTCDNALQRIRMKAHDLAESLDWL